MMFRCQASWGRGGGRRALLALPLALIVLGGCARRTYPVKGQVVFEDGTPAAELNGYLIMFQSPEQKSSATGEIQPDGTFTMGTFRDGDGAMLGKQRVAIMPAPPPGGRPRPPSVLPAKYATFDTSPLEVEITPSRSELTIQVERVRR